MTPKFLVFFSLIQVISLSSYARLIPISDIQGDTDISALKGSRLTTSGIVTANFDKREPYENAGFRGDIKGFFMQDPSGNPFDKKSDGIFVEGSFSVSPGDSVVLDAKVVERYGLTTLSEAGAVTIISSGNPLPDPVSIRLPLSGGVSFEEYESMLIQIENPLFVTENRNLDNYGELLLSAGNYLFQPTQISDPNDPEKNGVSASGFENVEEIESLFEKNASYSIRLDDARNNSYSKLIPWLSDEYTLRTGSRINGLYGVLSYSFNKFRIFPLQEPDIIYSRRPAPPSFTSELTLCSFNVLNYFNGDGQGGGFPTSRGAETYDDFLKQREKITAAILEIDPDIAGLIEIENDEEGPNSAISDLTRALNSKKGVNEYKYIETGKIRPLQGSADQIKVGIIYKKSSVSPVNLYSILNNSYSSSYKDWSNRPTLAQTFMQNDNSEIFTLVLSHLKSKGSDCNSGGDPDREDGQGNCNRTRTNAAATIAEWLKTDPTNSGDPDFILMGDLNSYSQEDPIDTLRSLGFVNPLSDSLHSYVYSGNHGTLDYGLISKSMQNQVPEAAIWNINSSEPDFLSYYGNTSYYEASAFWSSDHDPVILGLNLNSSPSGIPSFGQVENLCHIYPNPFSGSFTITTPAPDSTGFTVEIYSLSGNLVFHRNFLSAKGKLVITLSPGEDWPKGLYILSIKDLNVKKLIIKSNKQ